MYHKTTYWRYCLFSSPVLHVFVRDLFPLFKIALAIQGILLSKWTITSFHLIGSSAGLTGLINPCRQMCFTLCSLVLLFYVLSLAPPAALSPAVFYVTYPPLELISFPPLCGSHPHNGLLQFLVFRSTYRLRDLWVFCVFSAHLFPPSSTSWIVPSIVYNMVAVSTLCLSGPTKCKAPLRPPASCLPCPLSDTLY